MIAIAQTFGQAFVAWVPVVILNVGKYAPRFHLGFSIMSGLSVLEFAMIFVLRYFVNRQNRDEELRKTIMEESEVTSEAQSSTDDRPEKKSNNTAIDAPVEEIAELREAKH